MELELALAPESTEAQPTTQRERAQALQDREDIEGTFGDEDLRE